MGGAAAVVRRKRRHFRALVSWRGAMARCSGESSAPESHGSGHDVFHAAQFLLLRRRVRWLVTRLGLDEHRAGRSTAPKTFGTEDLHRKHWQLEKPPRASP